ncbi:2-dehydropantoate 2-reductase N-terminal domain-containing protein [Candidatus Pelagibacter communis]|uniref:2-dehydropantoate 2-reductase N-terminal domain-containing protein n=1 Tax=Pelagibacter ubique TaxID=198252 RepID=UPI00094CDB7B|nr:2-dehydropantoate 2-reductase N-terminal domain-containing protein [Candidatus Pelagibacter ubique]
MKKVLIIGAGAMGAAFSFPLLDNNNKVTLTEPYNAKLLNKLLNKKKFHPSLKITLPKKLLIRRFSSQLLIEKWDLIVVAVSSVGIELVKKYLKNLNKQTYLLILTKGLKFDRKTKKIITMSEQLDLRNKKLNISVLKGPCLAKELARKIKSYTVIANKNIRIARQIGKLVSAKYYKTEYSSDVRGIEFSSAIKNIYSMVIGSGEGNNTSSALFRKSFDEMEYLIQHFKGKKETVRGLAGLGDLYVSAVGGRNSKMGEYLGKGFSFKNAKNKFMTNDTVEGADLAYEIAPYILNKINKKKIPLMTTLLNAITKNKKLKINY